MSQQQSGVFNEERKLVDTSTLSSQLQADPSLSNVSYLSDLKSSASQNEQDGVDVKTETVLLPHILQLTVTLPGAGSLYHLVHAIQLHTSPSIPFGLPG